MVEDPEAEVLEEVDLEVVDLVGAEEAQEVAAVEEVVAVQLPTNSSVPTAVTQVRPTAYSTAPVVKRRSASTSLRASAAPPPSPSAETMSRRTVRSNRRKSASRLIRHPALTQILQPPALSEVGMVLTSSVDPSRLSDAALLRVNRCVQTLARSSASQRPSACARPPSPCKSRRSASTSRSQSAAWFKTRCASRVTAPATVT